MGQNSFSLPTGDHPFEQSTDYSPIQGDNILLDNSNQFDSPFPQVLDYPSGTYPVLHQQDSD